MARIVKPALHGNSGPPPGNSTWQSAGLSYVGAVGARQTIQTLHAFRQVVVGCLRVGLAPSSPTALPCLHQRPFLFTLGAPVQNSLAFEVLSGYIRGCVVSVGAKDSKPFLFVEWPRRPMDTFINVSELCRQQGKGLENPKRAHVRIFVFFESDFGNFEMAIRRPMFGCRDCLKQCVWDPLDSLRRLAAVGQRGTKDPFSKCYCPTSACILSKSFWDAERPHNQY